MTLCAMSAMAVSLPKNSYNIYRGTIPAADGYSLSVGTTFVNTSTVGAYADCLYPEYAKNDAQLFDACTNCCYAPGGAYDECLISNSEAYCDQQADACVDKCQGDSLALNDQREPLDAPTAFLLALIAAYGAVAVYRRKMQQV